ncbi:SixA phosphatase family protein [Geminicoccus roseus]|uniref:SixA phosphatase family protein n=1 Tax=Geminicoccus roseus TaxID=404900 RepID=UPI0004877B8E|nr:histidine phosphatase family protein [Geminicoccus roseus]
MVTILLLRHAKSRWDEGNLPDHERGLAPRGERAAPRVGHWAAMNGWLPDRVLCSTAARTVATARLFLAAAGIDPPVELRKEIYEARPSVLLALIQAQPEGGRLMLVGHNPGFHELALQLAGKGADPRLDEKFPTGALAAIEFDAPSFAEVRPGEGRLAAFALPRELE